MYDRIGSFDALVCVAGSRLNVVSPAPIVEKIETGKITSEMVAKEFIASIEGNETGKVFKVWNME